MGKEKAAWMLKKVQQVVKMLFEVEFLLYINHIINYQRG
jgi:hypothetical protein